tara:strand:+ start:66 stop:323 length:258 start_codon:yes stop_codon:yes gene_type:complete
MIQNKESLSCVYGEGPLIENVVVEIRKSGIDIMMPMSSSDGEDFPPREKTNVVWIENRKGVSYVCVCSDPMSDEPTHVIEIGGRS